MNFSDKLVAMLSENSVNLEFMGEPLNVSIDEDTIISSITAGAGLHGVKFLTYSEGVISFSTYQKNAVLSFTTFLDDNEYVENYDLSVVETDPFTHRPSEIESIDFDLVQESNHIEFFIDVVISYDYVNYDNVYVSDDEYDDSTFEYPENDNISSFDVLDQDQTPLLVKLSNINSQATTGKIQVTVHPKNETEIMVSMSYTQIPTDTEVATDLIVINNLGDSYNLNLVYPAEYNDGELQTTTAIYESINSSNVLNIVENFANQADSVSIDIDLLCEVQRLVKVNFRGKKRIKMKCQAGFKYDPERLVCVKIAGAELSHSRIAHRQMARTKKSKGQGYKKRILIKIRRANKFRKLLGLK